MANQYREIVEAVQFKKGHRAVMECIDLVERGGFKANWLLSSDSLKVGSDGCDGHIHYIAPGEWLVLRSDNSLQIVQDKDFQGRYESLPMAQESQESCS